MTHLLQEAAAL